MKLGIRHARANLRLRASIVRSAGFLLFASCYWSLLPLIANVQIQSGPAFYGFLLGMVGLGAFIGSFFLPILKLNFNIDQLVGLGTLGTATAMLLLGAAHHPIVGLVASFIAGVSWIIILPTLVSAAQLALPDWVRGRGIALYTAIQFGSMAMGSALWGQIGNWVGIAYTHYIAAFTILLTLFLSKQWPLYRDSDYDITPSEHWRDPFIAVPLKNEDGPVLIAIKYNVILEHRAVFIKDMKFIERQRRRTGAYLWELFEDIEKPNEFMEIFLVETWLDHLRQHERTIKHDLIVRSRIISYLENDTMIISHYIGR